MPPYWKIVGILFYCCPSVRPPIHLSVCTNFTWKLNISHYSLTNVVTRLIFGMKVHLINTHLVPRSGSSAKVKVKYQGHVSQKMGVSGALVFHKNNILLFSTTRTKATEYLMALLTKQPWVLLILMGTKQPHFEMQMVLWPSVLLTKAGRILCKWSLQKSIFWLTSALTEKTGPWQSVEVNMERYCCTLIHSNKWTQSTSIWTKHCNKWIYASAKDKVDTTVGRGENVGY